MYRHNLHTYVIANILTWFLTISFNLTLNYS